MEGLGKGADKTTYTIDDLTGRVLDTTEAEGRQIRSLQFAISRLNARPKLASTLIHTNGPLSDESFDRQEALANVYRRGLAEAGRILEGVRTEAGR